jgi:C1A family cysteine protease
MGMTGFTLRDRQTAVRDQCDRPTCAVFAVTAGHEAARADDEGLSVESALWSANRISGGQPPHATVAQTLEGITADGQAFEVDWPYGNPAHPAPPPAAAARKDHRVLPGPWQQLPNLRPATVERALRAGEAVILTLAFVRRAWRDGNGDGFIDAAPAEPIATGHAVLATGVGSWHTGVAVVEFKNSWDSDWGDSGYGYLSESYLTRHGRKAFALAAAA